MAFDHLNPTRYDNIASVDAAFAKSLQENLFKDSTFIPNVTFTTRFQTKSRTNFLFVN